MLRARSLVSSVGVCLGKRALASRANWERILKRRDVPAHMKRLLAVLRDSIDHLSEAVAAVEKEYASRLQEKDIQRLQEIPGVGPVVSLTTVASPKFLFRSCVSTCWI